MIRNIPNKYTQKTSDYPTNSKCSSTPSMRPTRAPMIFSIFASTSRISATSVTRSSISSMSVLSSRLPSSASGRSGENRFNSDKRCTLSYANIQGKLALIEKFRNSNVMDEELSYRPKIFYTNGPLAGEEEPFPAPTISKETRLRLRQLRQRRYHTNPQCKPSSFLDYYRDDEAEGDIPEEGATADSMDDMIADGDVIGTEEELGEPH
ncbi:hypothetical protein BC936DRAFT_142182 [Jimgerdemannia flammicorona]|uniref:Mei2-like C-terminal RNA recognition motif domain-containing protein n=1 Tax=Jimgerdemannia flammicorona TaxID=994334 RepID=A0A433A0W7_9FUNG|nr:hypothetical protein BC936DRAFT_142182 [Jimgerdemannia flammicorona]